MSTVQLCTAVGCLLSCGHVTCQTRPRYFPIPRCDTLASPPPVYLLPRLLPPHTPNSLERETSRTSLSLAGYANPLKRQAPVIEERMHARETRVGERLCRNESGSWKLLWEFFIYLLFLVCLIMMTATEGLISGSVSRELANHLRHAS